MRVYKSTPSVELDRGDYWSLGGIYRENYLVALPATHVEDVTVRTDLDGQYKNATLNATVKVSGGIGGHFKLSGELFALDGTKVAMPAIEVNGELDGQGGETVTLSGAVDAPKLWSAEKPNLYYLMLTVDEGGQVVERVQERFGFRKIEIRDGVLLFNGVPIKCTGTCRHEEFSPYGHALSDVQWKMDIALMKGANINAIRTSHYNHSARFLELCDEAGFYVLDEIPFTWVNTSDLARQWAFVQRAKETLARDKNLACVLAWSVGNESGGGPDAVAALTYMKDNDPTHPAFISEQAPRVSPKIDFQDAHYPSLSRVKQFAASLDRKVHPAIFTEQPHIFYVQTATDYDYGDQDFWGRVLDNNWKVVWPTDSIIGSFVWEWQDQGMHDNFADQRGVDQATGLRDNNHKGIVTATREPKPEYWNVKMEYSPVTTAAREVDSSGGECVIPLVNRYSFTDLSELTCRWQLLAGDKELQHGESHIVCPPRSSIQAGFPAMAGMDTLRIEFIHPDGRSIYVARIHTQAYVPPAPPEAMNAAGEVKLDQDDRSVRVQSAGTQLAFDKKSGQITSWQAGGQDLVLGGPILNLGELNKTAANVHGARSYLRSRKPPEIRNVVASASMNDGKAEIVADGDVFLPDSDQPKGKIHYVMRIDDRARMEVMWSMAWSAKDVNVWETGLKFLMPVASDQMTWLRDNLWTEYPRGHIGELQGTVTSKDISFRSSKRDLHWMVLSGAGKYGLVVLQGKDALHARGLAATEGNWLLLSSAIAPPADFSTDRNSNLAPEYTISLGAGKPPVAGSFTLEATDQARP